VMTGAGWAGRNGDTNGAPQIALDDKERAAFHKEWLRDRSENQLSLRD
jgi:hypothetical protein